jgi:hypothetical protein
LGGKARTVLLAELSTCEVAIGRTGFLVAVIEYDKIAKRKNVAVI